MGAGEGRRGGGAGVKKYANGDVYDGEWKDDKKNEKGEGEGELSE